MGSVLTHAIQWFCSLKFACFLENKARSVVHFETTPEGKSGEQTGSKDSVLCFG